MLIIIRFEFITYNVFHSLLQNSLQIYEFFCDTRLWNEAAKAGLLFGLVSVSCLALKELAGMSGSTFLSQAAFIVLWAVEFFGCILLMKKVQLDLRDKFQGVKMADTFVLGRRAALLSGLLLASAQALFVMYARCRRPCP